MQNMELIPSQGSQGILAMERARTRLRSIQTGEITTPKKDFLYLKVTHFIEKMIIRGDVLPGQKLPSIRQMMIDHQSSRTTIEKALNLMVVSGLVSAKDRSGYYVNDCGVLDPARHITFRNLPKKDAMIARLLLDADECDLTFSTAALHSSLVPDARLANLAASALKRFPRECVSLELAPGNLRFRTAVSKRLTTTGIKCSPAEVVVTAGDNAFLKKLFEILTQNGRPIGIDQVCYFGCLQAIRGMEQKIHKIPTNTSAGFNVEYALDLIESKKIGALFLNPTLNNPLGYTIPEADRIRLVRACENHDCFIIEDDIFSDLQNPNRSVKPLKAWDEKGVVIYLGSVSKTIAPGLRVGWCVPGLHYSRIVGEMLSENNAISSPAQIILSDLLGSDLYSDHLNRLRGIYNNQSQVLAMIVKDYFPGGTEVSCPRGGGIYWITLPEMTCAENFFSEVAERGIKISPGSIFGANEDSPAFRLCLTKRLNSRSKAAIMELGRIAQQCSTFVFSKDGTFTGKSRF